LNSRADDRYCSGVTPRHVVTAWRGSLTTRARWLSLCVTALALSAAACVQTRHAVAAEPGGAKQIPLDGTSIRGPQNAAVTIVEFSDFQCPYCAQAKVLVDQVLAAYPKDVNFAYKNFPLPMHANADPAARAALAAGRQGKFWEMHDELFKHSADLSPFALHAIAEKLRLNVSKFEADMNSPTVKQQLDTEVRQGKVAGVRGTPTFFINGRMAQTRSLEGFKAMIETELKKKSG
jgi:protein-disulfide isomerase